MFTVGQVMDEVRHGFAQVQVDRSCVQLPAWRKSGLGTMLTPGLRWAVSLATAAAAPVLATTAGAGLADVAGADFVVVGVDTVLVAALVAVARAAGVALARWRAVVVLDRIVEVLDCTAGCGALEVVVVSVFVGGVIDVRFARTFTGASWVVATANTVACACWVTAEAAGVDCAVALVASASPLPELADGATTKT